MVCSADGPPLLIQLVVLAGQADVQRHDPLPGRRVPIDLRVAVAAGDLRDDRIAGELGVAAAVGAGGDALHGGTARGRVDEHLRGLAVAAQAAGVLPVDHRRAAEHRPQGVRRQGVADLLPVHQVAADGVAPVHVAPIPAVRVVLVEEMILAAVEDQPVGIVVPAAPRGEVELRPQRLAIEIRGALDLVGLVDRSERGGAFRQLVDLQRDRLAAPRRTCR